MGNNKRTINWITADYFIDVDIDIINSLSQEYNINWIIFSPQNNNRFSTENIEKKIINKKIKIKYFINNYRFRDIRNIITYYKMLNFSTQIKSEITYINMQGFPYLAILAQLMLNKDRTIFAVHQAKVHEGMSHKRATTLYFNYLYSTFKNFQLFSETQASIFRHKYPNKSINIIPLALKDFGKSNEIASNDKIIFLNFGNIIKSKNISCLINAACKVYEQGYKNIRIKIVGRCENWPEYENLIKYPKIFDLRIESIKNEEIPDLFCSSHYLVLPYSAVSQSGPLKIAYNYNIPIIASDLDEFKNEITDNKTGYLFKCSDSDELAKTMIKSIINHANNYSNLKANQLEYIQNKYSMNIIKDKYINMFNKVLS